MGFFSCVLNGLPQGGEVENMLQEILREALILNMIQAVSEPLDLIQLILLYAVFYEFVENRCQD